MPISDQQGCGRSGGGQCHPHMQVFGQIVLIKFDQIWLDCFNQILSDLIVLIKFDQQMLMCK